MRELLALALLAAGPVVAGSAGAEERLDFFPPEGFAGVHLSEAGGVRLTEYVLDGETLEAWSEAVTVAEIAGGMRAEDFVTRLVADKKAACTAGFDLDPAGTEAGGRVSTISIHACPNYDRSERSEVALLRTIEGDGRLFAVQRAWARTPPREELDAWTERLRAIRLCDGGTCR